MSSKIAVAVVHGMGNQPADFHAGFARGLRRRYARRGGNEADLVIRPVHWAEVLSEKEQHLLDDMYGAAPLDWTRLREFLVHFLADVAAYQIVPRERETYDAIHAVFAHTLAELAIEAGPSAPLVLVAHSLGSVIASNYVYDLQKHDRRPALGVLPPAVRHHMRGTPLEWGHTLAVFATLGSPLALFSLRWDDRGVPIMVPSPHLSTYHPTLNGRWVNFYDRDDVIAWPLRPLNLAYANAVSEDRLVDVGPWPLDLTPLAHTRYMDDGTVQDLVADLLPLLRS